MKFMFACVIKLFKFIVKKITITNFRQNLSYGRSVYTPFNNKFFSATKIENYKILVPPNIIFKNCVFVSIKVNKLRKQGKLR